ncbi:MAG TPA: sugar kinase [Steroidobacteraceae bacterium]|nr:sugar kinase [Steroidobacteraceae bacterium]
MSATARDFALDVVTYGEPLVVFAAQEAGPLAQAQHFRRSIAGAELNVAVGLARLGLKVGYVSRIGADCFGEFVMQTLRQERIDASQVRIDAAQPTGFYLKSRAADGSDPLIEYHRKGSAASRLSPADYDAAYFAGARHLHLSGVAPAISHGSLELAVHIAREARAAGVQHVSFDPNLRPVLWPGRDEMVRQMRRLAALAQWVMPGLEEGRTITGAQSPAAIAEFFLRGGAQGVVIKLGAAGAYLKTAREELTVAAAPVKHVIDTVGAGDGFAVGFISALLEGRRPGEAVARGNIVAALAIQAAGDSDGLPARTLLDSLEAGTAR